MSNRQRRLAAAHLYLVCGAVPETILDRALDGGVDIVQLRLKDAADEEILAAAARVRPLCQARNALLIINDRPDLAVAAGADGTHVGQDDMSLTAARQLIGPDLLLGLSTHSEDQIDAANRAGVDYIGVGPVNATPTKPGRPAVGVELVRYAATHSALPFFAIGGIDSDNVEAVGNAGARRVAVVRALTEATDPQRVARRLRDAITQPRAAVHAA